ncbi:unnamed protein product [Rotaria socialis]|uniref:Uncharacterized protein n=1 Tax=Rotaria socialis TaxID=392032 RepID=A0A818PUC8_9BILA|nr:unnamed protein product [Rotaria socialis]CAF4099038.1 unnamed protein product [Rotaria socialis]
MRRLLKSRKTVHSNENHDIGNPPQKSAYFRQKPLSHVVSTPLTPVPESSFNARIVRIRLVFIRIGEIDTLNEKYQADIYYEARWIELMNVSLLNLTTKQQGQLLNGNVTVRLNDFNRTIHWTPELFVENAIGQIGEQDTWFTIKKHVPSHVESSSPLLVRLEICEHRRIRGVFWEKLELNHVLILFPADVQDLTISISTIHYLENCLLVPDDQLRSSINREAFYDQQEWKLYAHVATELRQTKEEYSFEDEDSGVVQKKHPVLAFTCRAGLYRNNLDINLSTKVNLFLLLFFKARRPNYYYWNGFCLIFLINVCAFCIFSIPPDLPQNRLQITSTLVLTSVTFRWVVNRSLPTVSYLTALDRYAILSIILLVLLCGWHAIIALFIFLSLKKSATTRSGIDPDDIHVHIDRYVGLSVLSIYIISNIVLIIWFICVPYKRRREMEYLDREYASKKYIQLQSTRTRFDSIISQAPDLTFRRGSLINGALPMIKSPERPIKHTDNVTIISNDATFLPIQEEGHENATQPINTIEFHEPDEVLFDHTNK